jgi:2-keto-4-pentenoate hydratase/2-oxohepta-3-ene-1,7-dioic acid hydratase in catechol pathway
MRLMTFRLRSMRSHCSLGAELDGKVVDLPSVDPTIPKDMLQFIKAGADALQAARSALQFVRSSGVKEDLREQDGSRVVYEAEEVIFLAPIPRPPKILAIGLNYRSHIDEVAGTGLRPTELPFFFSKLPSAVVGPDEPVVLPALSQEVDYEIELAFVVGKRAKHVLLQKAMGYVAGYTIFNDISARDIQLVDSQITLGKNFDSFAPMGPYLVTADEIPDPHSLALTLRLNGVVMQHDNTRNLIHRIPEMLSFLSKVMTLEPGTVVATGTPSGVGFQREPPTFLQPGDVMTLEIEGLGVLENPVVAEAS